MLGYIQTRNGLIAAVLVGLALSYAVMQLAAAGKTDHPVDDPSALASGPLRLIVVSKEQAGDGVVVVVEITNISDKPVNSCKGTLTAKDLNRRRLLSEDQQLLTPNDQALQPGESMPAEFFFYDQYLEEIKFFSFLATFVNFDEA